MGAAAGAADRTAAARAAVRRVLPVEADLGFRRRCEMIVELLGVDDGARVLDCGCGYGFTLALLRRLTGAELVGLDPEAERVAFARRQLGDDPRVELVRGDAQAMPFPDGAFDAVVCSEVLEHVANPAAALAEIGRVLRAGGRLVATVPSADYPIAWDPINYALERATGRHLVGERPWSGIWHGHQRLYTAVELRRQVEAAGLRVEVERALTQRTFPFAHLTLYGVLKPLLQHGWAPGGGEGMANRFGGHEGRAAGVPSRLAMRALEWIDGPNDDPGRAARARRSLGLAVSAVKP